MIAARWRKVLRDIAESPGRTMLAIVAMAAGTFGLGTILTAYSILARELATTYGDTHPASAILVSDIISDELVESVRRLPGISDAEARLVIRGRLRIGQDEWAPLILFVVRDFNDLRIDKFKRDAGAWPPKDDEVVLERTALSVARTVIGESVTVKTSDGAERSLRVAGSVHAAGLAPAWMDHVVSGFVTWNSIIRAAAKSEPQTGSVWTQPVHTESAQLRIVVAEHQLDEGYIRDIAERARIWLETQGDEVSRIDVPVPGRHPHADQMDTFLFLLGAFGALTLALSAVLVANMIHALLAEQVKQIGVMKAIGAITRQVATLYLGQVSMLAAISLCIGLPLGLWAGGGYADFAATILNATITSHTVPSWIIILQIAVGMGVPLVVALGPVYRASRISIHQAFSDDIGFGPFGSRHLDKWLARIKGLPGPLLLSLRTMFQRRGRLFLTVGTLAAGGAVFISALTMSAAWTRMLASDADARRYDLDVRLWHVYPVEVIASALSALPDVTRAEYWAEAAAEFVQARQENGENEAKGIAEDRVNLFGPEWNTQLLHLALLQGRWLNADDSTAVVVNQAMLARRPALRLGSDIALRVNGKPTLWTVVGVVKEMSPAPTAYAPSGAVRDLTGRSRDMTVSVRVVTRQHDAAAQLSASKEIEHALQLAGVSVQDVQSLSDRRKAFEDHLVIVKSALLLAATLVVLVGGLGLMTTLMLNVVERTREFGILRAIGATPRTISRYVVFEGVLIGVSSWCVAVVLAVPTTWLLGAVAGNMFVKTPLDFFFSPRAVATWLALVVILAALSSFYPAWRAARLTVREALAYA